jgi:hypothetical protein
MLIVIYLSLPSAKSEIRISKFETNETLKSEIQNSESENELVWNFALFDHWNLFRISDFVFRIFFLLQGYFLPSNSFAAVATWSGSKPNFLCSSFSGADAPKVFMPIMRPDLPM